MKADARQSDFCVYLSAILLAGLVSMPLSDGGGLIRSLPSLASGIGDGFNMVSVIA